MSSSKPILYSYWRSSCSWRVRIALELKGIEYEYKAVNLLASGQIEEPFLKLNPRGMVPAFIYDGKTYSESMAIIEFIDEKFQNGPSLLPKTPEERAIVRSLAYGITSNIQPLQNLNVLKYIAKGDQQKSNEHAHHFIQRGFNALEKDLSKTAGKYCFGDTITIADLCIPPQVYNATRFGVNMDEYPTIKRLNETLSAIPEFIKADAWHQPDTPDAEKKN
uniref:Maleylacetoacetate isomerase n=1 Tax=Panagrolaimus sp. PS1159 TaxID=55785 RepID=A0AC35FF78_9BILA